MCHVFAETIHVVAAPLCGHTRNIAVYFKFYRNQFKRFRATDGRNVAILYTLAIGFHKGLYTSVQAMITVRRYNKAISAITMSSVTSSIALTSFELVIHLFGMMKSRHIG